MKRKFPTIPDDTYDAIMALENVVINKFGLKKEYIEQISKYISNLLTEFYTSYEASEIKNEQLAELIYDVAEAVWNCDKNMVPDRLYENLIHFTADKILLMLNSEVLEYPDTVKNFSKELDNQEKLILAFHYAYKLSGCENELMFERTKKNILNYLVITPSEYQIKCLQLKRKKIEFGITETKDNELEEYMHYSIYKLTKSSMPRMQ